VQINEHPSSKSSSIEKGLFACEICGSAYTDSSWGRRSETFGFCCSRCVSQACRSVRRHNVRARDAVAPGKLYAYQWLSLLYAYDFKCACCRSKKALTLDHIVPLSKNGHNQTFNVQPLCLECHRAKDNIPPSTRKCQSTWEREVKNGKKEKRNRAK